MAPLLRVQDLRVSFASHHGHVQAVDGVSLEVGAGEILAVVGESGSGKSVTALTLIGLTRAPGARIEGSATLGELDLLQASEEELEGVRGRRIAMVFQDALSALNPVYRVGDQIVEQIRAHEDVSRVAARRRSVELLQRVGIPGSRERARAYPHELSGGMRQRAVIAMALSCGPELLLADEPTTALDVTIQAQILRLVADLRDEVGIGVILITHDLGVVAEVADRVAVMYAGQIVEEGSLEEVFYDPQHPYTWGLLGCISRVDRPRAASLPAIPGRPPSLAAPPSGCRFAPRCPHSFAACAAPPPLAVRAGHPDRCWLEPAEKRLRRVVEGRIGLVAGATR